MAESRIHGVPDEIAVRIDAAARRSGLSTAAYLRRSLLNAAAPTGDRVTKQDLIRLTETFADLENA
ncbi:antitoxin [Flindersiella endophytica]